MNREDKLIRRSDGKVIGKIIEHVFIKTVIGSVHFLRTPPGIAWDVDAVREAESKGAKYLEVIDSEKGKKYFCTIKTFWEKGFSVNRGYGKQWELKFKHWTDDKAKAKDPEVIKQERLFA